MKNIKKNKNKSSRTIKSILFSIIKLSIFGFFIASIVGFVFIVIFVFYFSDSLPSVSSLKEEYNPPQTTKILSSDGQLLGEIFTERRTVVPFNKIPRVLVNAVLAAEDANFYHHEGFDYWGIIRAIIVNIKNVHFSQGGSTITQQVIRTFFLGREKTFTRKFKELLLARRLEQYLSKDEILFLYLNQINFGHARYGIEEASLFYFGKHVQDLNLAEAAMLAGMPKGPSIYSPRINMEEAKQRRAYVLRRMIELSFITEDQGSEAMESPINLAPLNSAPVLCPEIIQYVKNNLEQRMDKQSVQLGGYSIYTTIDSKMQEYARSSIRIGLEEIDSRHGYNNPFIKKNSKKARRRDKLDLSDENTYPRDGNYYVGKVIKLDDSKKLIEVQVGKNRCSIDLTNESRYNPDKIPPTGYASINDHVPVLFIKRTSETDGICKLARGPQSALIVIESHTGKVRAIVGGYESRTGDFNRATQSKRQPGSSFKPIVYSYGLISRRFTPATVITDAPEVYDDWRPNNAEPWSYEGSVRLRIALAKSINMVAIKLIQALGPENIVNFAHTLGIVSPLDPSPSLALGSSGVSPLEIATAYSTFANGGLYVEPYFIEKIVDSKGKNLLITRPQPKRVMTEAEAYLTTSMLQSVVQEGTATMALKLRRAVAGKTGTSNNNKDAWFVGYTPQLVCSVWVGFDDNRPLGGKEFGAKASLPIWFNFMKKAHSDLPVLEFLRPSEGLEGPYLIDPQTGLLSYEGQTDAIEEIFLEGTAPREKAIPPDIATVDQFLMEQSDENSN